MSRYFEAFHKTNPDAVEQVLPEAPGPLVSGRARPETSGSPAAVPPVEIAAVPAAAQPVEVPVVPPASPFQFPERVRKVSIRFHAGAPVFPFDGTDTIAAERYRSVRTKLIQHPSRPKLSGHLQFRYRRRQEHHVHQSGSGAGAQAGSYRAADECDFRRPSWLARWGCRGSEVWRTSSMASVPFPMLWYRSRGFPTFTFYRPER